MVNSSLRLITLIFEVLLEPKDKGKTTPKSGELGKQWLKTHAFIKFSSLQKILRFYFCCPLHASSLLHYFLIHHTSIYTSKGNQQFYRSNATIKEIKKKSHFNLLWPVIKSRQSTRYHQRANLSQIWIVHL